MSEFIKDDDPSWPQCSTMEEFIDKYPDMGAMLRWTKKEEGKAMDSFRTQKGTELPFIDLRGKPYLQVAHRLVWFREEHPDWGIETEVFPSPEHKSCLAKAIIRDASGRIVATSHKVEDAKGFGDFIEKSETGAVGRALALCGYGTQFASDDLDEGDRIVDSPVVPSVISPKIPPVPLPQPKSERDEANKALMALYKPYLEKFPQTKFPELLMKRYNANETRLLTIEQLRDLVHFVKAGIEGEKPRGT